jgi:hypothetical protein
MAFCSCCTPGNPRGRSRGIEASKLFDQRRDALAVTVRLPRRPCERHKLIGNAKRRIKRSGASRDSSTIGGTGPKFGILNWDAHKPIADISVFAQRNDRQPTS